MRIKLDPQDPLDFGPARLKVTEAYYEKYRVVDRILAETPEILSIFHQRASSVLNQKGRKRRARFTSDQLLRAILVMEIEGLPYRDAVVRIDDSVFLRRFVRVHDGPVMDFTLLCKAYKAIPACAWHQMNQLLARYALDCELIMGDQLRADTTVCETNIHFPTDAALLWDAYRVTARLIAAIRSYDPTVVGTGRLQERAAKRRVQALSRLRDRSSRSGRRQQRKAYQWLLARVRGILEWSRGTRRKLRASLETGDYDFIVAAILKAAVSDLDHLDPLTMKVIDQAERRVIRGESVPNDEKVFSIFEPHTELVIRGKAGKSVEFGHVVLLQQVENQFISDYQVFLRRPSDASLVDSILASHEDTFGRLPDAFTADKGFYESMPKLAELAERIPHVSIAKKGKRTEQERAREHTAIFRELQRFRAGIEGSISALKRAFKMARCLYRSFETYCSSVGCHVFTHNLIALARL